MLYDSSCKETMCDEQQETFGVCFLFLAVSRVCDVHLFVSVFDATIMKLTTEVNNNNLYL
jgi:hypothetical protein